MSYMRAPLYAWDDGYKIHLWAREGQPKVYADPLPDEVAQGWWPGFTGGVAIDRAIFDALALMRVAELHRSPKRLKAALRVAKANRGNFSACDLLDLLKEAK